ncbi:MAG: hypothetical protein KIT43_04570 [Bauldia sp.]|nr:hypothetical protein [Bauldia sp.]MCW5717956.1 hypothetical protein [Bauldia sp.]
MVAALAGAAAAQPVSREELDELLARVVVTDSRAFETTLEGDLGFPPGSAALLGSFTDSIYSSADFQTYLLARIEEVDRAVVLQSIGEFAAAARTEAYRDGTLRLPPSGLLAFVDHIHEILTWLAATDPALCAVVAREPAAVLDDAEIELEYFAQISPEELRSTLRYRTAAITAETSQAPPWHAFSRAELAAGRAALAQAQTEATTLPPPLIAACSAVSVCVPPPTEDQARCRRSLLQLEAFGALAEPERSWAIAAFIVDL